MKLDIRKYIFANVIVVLAYTYLILWIVFKNTDFPPYQPGWGEGPVPSDEEEGFIQLLTICYFFWFASFLFLTIEIIVRFLFRKFVKNKLFFIKLNFPKSAVIAYTILFNIGFIPSLCLFAWHFIRPILK